jgi:hypothetical protein
VPALWTAHLQAGGRNSTLVNLVRRFALLALDPKHRLLD